MDGCRCSKYSEIGRIGQLFRIGKKWLKSEKVGEIGDFNQVGEFGVKMLSLW